MCMMICLPLLLLSLTAGMYLLAKTRSENLGSFFKFVSWLIIIGAFAGMLCMAICSFRYCGSGGCYGKGYGTEYCGPGGYCGDDGKEMHHHEMSDSTMADTTGRE